MAKVAAWLFANAKRMDKAMFFNSQADWSLMNVDNVIALRAAAPDDVFNKTSEPGYLIRVGDVPELAELSDCLFGDDYQFVTRMPASLRNPAIQLMQMTYRENIRKADSRVKAM